ncbi:MAG TPA: DUF945 domain-containing protein [Legionella sp.]|nr:DUF945 domain-containing protein [Legionella sp.]
MKKIAGLAVFLAVLILGSYYGTGIVTERTLKKNIALLDQSNGWAFEVAEYKRGFYRSYALLNARFHIPARTFKDSTGQESTQPAVDIALKIPLDIYHGPMIYADSQWLFGLGYAHSDMTIPETYERQFKETFTADSTKPHLNLSVFISYLNNSSILSELTGFKLITMQGKKEFDLLGITSDLQVSAHANHLQGQIILDGMRFKDGMITATAGKTNVKYDLNRTKLAFYIGDADVVFPSMVVMNGDQKTFEVQNLNIHSSSHIQGDLLDYQFKLTLDTFYNEGKSFSPILLDVSIRNLDADTLVKINHQTNHMQQGTEAERHQALLSMLPELPKLVSKGAQFAVNELSIGTPEGGIKGNLLLSLPNAVSDNPFQLIQSIKGDGKLTLSAAVVKKFLNDEAKRRLQMQSQVAVPAAADVELQAMAQTDEQLLKLVSSGLLSLEGNDYVIVLKLAGGQLRVNGKPFNPAMMQF